MTFGRGVNMPEKTLRCGHTDCTAQLDVDNVPDIADAATRAGWQYRFAVGYWMSEDDAGTSHLTRCSDHLAHPQEFGYWEVRATSADQALLTEAHTRLDGRVLAATPVVQDEHNHWHMTVRCYAHPSAQKARAVIEACGAHGIAYPAKAATWGPLNG